MQTSKTSNITATAGTEGKPETSGTSPRDLSQYEVCVSALLDVQKAYQEMFDVMPVAWQTFDDIVTNALEQSGILGAPDPNSTKRHCAPPSDQPHGTEGKPDWTETVRRMCEEGDPRHDAPPSDKPHKRQESAQIVYGDGWSRPSLITRIQNLEEYSDKIEAQRDALLAALKDARQALNTAYPWLCKASASGIAKNCVLPKALDNVIAAIQSAEPKAKAAISAAEKGSVE